MPLPGDLTVITVTGTYLDPFGNPLSGVVTFVLGQPETDPVGKVTLAAGPYIAPVVNGSFSITLPCTDNANLNPANFAYTVAEQVGGVNRQSTFQLPHSLGASVDISTLVPVAPPTPYSTIYGVLANTQTWTGGNTFSGPVAVPTPTLSGQAATKGYVDSHGGGGGTAPTVRESYFTAGNVTFGSDASWALYTAVQLAIPAAVGDWVEMVIGGMWAPSSDFIDWAVVGAGGVAARYASTGTGTPAVEGDPGFYPQTGYVKGTGLFAFQATSSDIVGGNITFTVAHKGTPGGGVLFASTSYPLRMRLLNLHTVT